MTIELSPAEQRELQERELRTRTCEQLQVEQIVNTATAAVIIDREPQTLRRWACTGSGPIQPCRINGRLGWRLSELRALTKSNSVAA